MNCDIEEKETCEKLNVREIDESETMNIYSHQIHQKRMKQSAILELETPEKVKILGHRNCQQYMEEQVRQLLAPAPMHPQSQEILLSGIKEVFTDEDREMLSAEPTLAEVKAEVLRGNQIASPGSDGIILYFYKFYWKEVGEYLHLSVLDNFRQKALTKSQSIGLVVFGNKPGKGNSIKFKDKRRISLLNADYKINSGIFTSRLNKLSVKGLSPAQYVAGPDRHIHHCINMARDAVYKGNLNTRKGCGIQDNDFRAAFDLMMSSWPAQVLEKKGCGEIFKRWMESFFTDVVSTVVVNGVAGATIMLERSLRQGDIPSMLLFAYGLDPYLERLRDKLEGIVVYSEEFPVHGPVLEGEAALPAKHVEERLTAFGYADDVKNCVTSLQELIMVDEETKLFEQASGCELHRDPTSQKVKFLPLGKWRGKLRQEDLPAQCAHVSIADHLDMLGLPLYATHKKTLKENGDEMQKKSKNTVGPWLIRRVPLTQRPWSLNTYLYPKLYHRCHAEPLRKTDINEITKQTNRFLFCDQFEKPGPLVKYRSKDEGGLGLHSIKEKSMAFLIKSFLETAVHSDFQRNRYHEAIFKFYVRKDTSIRDPGLPPYFSMEFVQSIRQAEERKLPIDKMSSKDWYIFLLNKNIMEETAHDGSVSQKKCKAEMLYPTRDWTRIWSLARSKGLSNESRSFLFRMLHNLHPTKARIHRLNPRLNPQPFCSFCEGQEMEESLNHIFSSECSQWAEVMDWMLSVLQKFDPSITYERIVSLQLEPTNADCQLECVFLIAETLAFIMEKRQANKRMDLDDVKAKIRARVETLQKSSSFREHGTNLLTMIDI